jgi:hypothetical protein
VVTRDDITRMAKVGQRYPAAEPLPASAGRMRHVARWVLVCIAALWLSSLVMVLV